MNDFNIPGWDTPEPEVHEHVRWLRNEVYSASDMPGMVAARYEAMERLLKYAQESGGYFCSRCISKPCNKMSGVHHYPENCPELKKVLGND